MSLILDLKRVTREGLVAFWRNKLVSFSSLLVMTMSLLVFSSLIFVNGILDFSLAQLEDRVDVNVYFMPEANTETVLEIKEKIALVPEVRDVEYVSREEALSLFNEKHADDNLIQQSLDELGENPLGAALNIRAHKSTQYETVVASMNAIVSSYDEDLIERVNYLDNKNLIDRLNSFSNVARNVVYAVMLFFGIIAFLVVLSTMRIIIYSMRGEIEVKRLVGAEHRYVRGPFIVNGLLYGAIAGLLATIALYPASSFITSKTISFFAGMNILDFYLANIFYIAVILVAGGALLGMFSSYVALRKYLKI